VFQKVLVPLDGSRFASRVLPHARRLLADGGSLSLLRVLDPELDHDAEHGNAAQVAAARQLEELKEELARQEVQATTQVLYGRPGEVIRVAGRGHDLIAMSTHARTGLDRWLHGSVAEEVLRHADAPLLLLNPAALELEPRGPIRTILVPLDGSPRGHDVLDLVEGVARRHQARVKLLRVEPLPITEVPSPAVVPQWDPDAVRRTLAGPHDLLAASGVPVETEAAFGFEAAAIAEATSQVDLVVLGTHGRTGLLRLLLGSVAEDVIHHAKCPCLVQRLEERED
jgi:nucleotide-binding universal stress UspA family protein